LRSNPRGSIGIETLLGALVLAVAATAAIWNLLPQTDTLRSTLRIAPFTALALVILGRAIKQAGGRRLPSQSSRVEALAWAGWLVAVAFLESWTLGSGTRLRQLLFVAFALLLAHRFVHLIVAARPLLRAPGGRVPAVFFLAPAIIFIALLPWQSAARSPDGDEPYYLLMAHSLAYDGDLDLANNYEDGSDLTVSGRELAPQVGDPVGSGGELYSRHNLPLPLLLAPIYRLFGAAGAKVLMALLAAALGWAFLGVARSYFPESPGAVLLAYITLVVTAPLAIYSYQIWVEMPAGLLLLAGLGAIHSIEKGTLRRGNGFALLAIVVALPLIKARFLLFSISLLGLALLRANAEADSRRRLWQIAGALSALVALVLAANAALFGNPLKYHETGPLIASFGDPAAYLRGFFGLFFDGAFGLFASAPIWLLILPGLVAIARSHRRLAGDLAVLTLPYIAVVVPRLEWYGGWGPPFRYALALLPLLTLALVPPLVQRKRLGPSIAIAVLVTLSVGTTLFAISEPGTTYSFADGRGHLVDSLTRLAGHDIARFVPSFVRPRAANWVWPIASLGILLLLWGPGRGGRLRSARSPLPVGAAVALGLVTLLLQAATALPMKTVEFEDPYVAPGTSILYPDRWRPARAAYRGGQIVTKRDTLSTAPVPGGSRLDVTVEIRAQQRKAKETFFVLSQGDRELCREPIEGTGAWLEIRCPDSRWEPEGGPLRFEIDQSAELSKRNPRVIFDRAVLHWSD